MMMKKKTNRSTMMDRMGISYIFLACFVIIFSAMADARTAYEAIADDPELSMFKDLLDKDTISQGTLKAWTVTVFVPNNNAMKTYMERNSNGNLISDLYRYHTVSMAIKKIQFSTLPSVTSFHAQMAPLFLSVVDGPASTDGGHWSSHSNDEKAYFVNNALIVESHEDLRTTNNEPQSMFVIDEVLTPFKSTAMVPPNALQLMTEPRLYGLNVDTSAFLEYVKQNQLETVFNAPGANTFFLPTKMPGRNTPGIDEYVVKAHVIKSKALFTRTMGNRRKYSTLANDDKVDVELSFINNTIRFTDEQIYYIQTNTVKNDAVHKPGRVLSRLTMSNIPVSNGVIHIIEKPLMLMDMSVRDILRQQTKLGRFFELLQKHQDVLSDISRNPNKTVLAPDDNAFNNLMVNNQNFSSIGEDSEEMKKLLRQHVVYHQVSSSDLRRVGGMATYASASGVPVVFRLIGTDTAARLTVESGGVNATSLSSDFGASDGIVHIIDRVLGMPFNTIYEKLSNHALLNQTLKIGAQGGSQNWNTKLADQNKRYTFFAPSNAAWKQFEEENPSEFKQLDTGIYPSIGRAILDRHLSAKGQFNKKDLLQMVRKVDTIQGELLIKPDPSTHEIIIEWEGKGAKIIESDIYGLNGVVHIIDQVLAKRRDFIVNSVMSSAISFTGTLAACLVPLLIILIV